MDEYTTPAGTKTSDRSIHWQGHVMLFPRHDLPRRDPAGIRLLVVFVILEGVLGPRLSLLALCHLTVPPPWLRIPLMLAAALLGIRFFAAGASGRGFSSATSPIPSARCTSTISRAESRPFPPSPPSLPPASSSV